MHVDQFVDLGLNVMDVNNQKKTMVNWTNLVKSKRNNEGFSYYIASFMSILYIIFNNSDPPKILPKAQYLLQMRKYLKAGNCFLFKDYVEVRLYGADVPPYRLLYFFPISIFALEFIRQSLNLD